MDRKTEEKLLAALKEVWAQDVAEQVVGLELHPGINLDTALAAARCASLWVDGLKDALDKENSVDEDQLLKTIKSARDSALESATGLDKYPSGVPTIRTMIALRESFILAFDNPEEQTFLRELLASDNQ